MKPSHRRRHIIEVGLASIGWAYSPWAACLAGVRTLTGNLGFEVKQQIAKAAELVVEADKQLLGVAPASVFEC